MKVVRGKDEYTVAEGHDWFWPQFADGSWEPSTFKIFDKFLTSESTMLDIGAWIGPTALYAASRAKKVFAFEPDPIAYFSLIQNLALNRVKNVVPYPVAVSNEWKGIPFGVKTAAGDSMSSELWAKGDVEVPAVRFAALVHDIGPDFIKIDIEGGEKHIFDGSEGFLMANKPTIHLSLHTPWFKDDLEGFKESIAASIGFYPFFYNEDLEPIALEDAFDVGAFNAVVASYRQLV